VSTLLDSLIAGWRASSALELAALVSGLGYALLAVRRDRRCWILGGLSSATLAWLAANSRLPMQALLQAVYVVLSVYGFRSWTVAGQGARAAVGSRPLHWHAAAVGTVAVLALALAPAVAAASPAAWPRIDTATTLASLLATWMVARVLLENWLYWIVIDAVSVFLYAAQGLALVALLYAAYLAIAVAGYFSWRSTLHAQRSAR
jgi:nicotinamide mononucleotide transporter